MKIFFDANVLFAACYNPAGTPAQLLEQIRLGSAEGVSSQYVWTELVKNIKRKAPQQQDEIEYVRRLINIHPFSPMESDPIELRPKDIPIYRAAQFFDCDVLVTGDLRDFGLLMAKPNLSIRIMTPRQCLNFLTLTAKEHFHVTAKL